MKKLDKFVKKAIEDILYPEPFSYGWPPTCTGVFYQPERPVAPKSLPAEDTISVKEE